MQRLAAACLAALAATVGPSRAQDVAVAPGSGGPLVLEHVNLVDVRSGSVQADRTIVVKGADIDTVLAAPPAVLPDSAFVLDLAGCWVMPGLIDSHVHISHEGRAATEDALKRALLGGITTVRDMGGDARRLASLQRDAWLGEIAAPDVYYSSVFAGPAFFTDPRVVDVTRGRVPGETPWARAIRPSTDAREAVLEAKGAGASAIKIYADLPPADVARVTAAAHAAGLRAWSHATIFPSRPSDAVSAGVDAISHASMLYWEGTKDVPAAYGPHRDFPPPDTTAALSPALVPLFAAMKRRGTILDATLFVTDEVARRTEDPKRKAAAQAYAAYAKRAVRAAHAAGVTIDAGTDDLIADGADLPNLHEELRLLVAAGLSPMDAIRAATRTGAEVLGLGATLGEIGPGRRANLVVLSADPTADISNTSRIRFVVKGGRLFVRQ